MGTPLRSPGRPTPRTVADRYVDAVTAADPLIGLRLGVLPGDDRLPDYSPEGLAQAAQLDRATLAELGAVRAAAREDPAERRCARLLDERLRTRLALHDAGEYLVRLNAVNSPLQAVRGSFLTMPTATDDDWIAVAGRMAHVPAGLIGYRAALRAGAGRGIHAATAQITAVLDQLGTWLGRPSWFAQFAAKGPERLRPRLDTAAQAAASAFASFRDWLEQDYAPMACEAPDAFGRDRYALWAAHWTGSRVDLDEAYAWGWEEIRRIGSEMRAEAARVLPGASPQQALEHLRTHGQALRGASAARDWLQQLMDQTVAALDGKHFALHPALRAVEARIAPAGSAAAPYYTPPSLDFARPGRTWLPAAEHERIPVHDIVSVWYHEGVPGHHLQAATRIRLSDQLSRYQATLGSVNADIEGWAMYAERLMDELGFFEDPALRLGHLDGQMMRAVRIVVDIGVHLRLPVPADETLPAGTADERHWTPRLARAFLRAHSRRSDAFLDSELTRYLGMPAQAIGYKLGERAWLGGRAAAKARRGPAFDLREWHRAALAQGPLGLDSLAQELATL
ncbi:DUF885 domain-containing protein [Streptomyces sp. NPDC002018]|uniref:DUF885 domain-containing protein n=1 Tax=Streptomyces sp. NPDC002018 TaxID=3364629 RepID=UPI003685E191